MKTKTYIQMTAILSLAFTAGCRENASQKVASKPVPTAPTIVQPAPPSIVLPPTNRTINAGIRHVTAEEIILETEPGEDVRELIKQDTSLIDELK